MYDKADLPTTPLPVSDDVQETDTTTALNTASASSRKRKRKMAEDECDAIGDLIGHYGKWQCLMTLLCSLFQIPNTFHIYSPIFQAPEKLFWCRRPPNLNGTNVELWRNLSQSTDNCHILNYEWDTVPVDKFRPDLLLPPNLTFTDCTSWEYDSEDNLGNTWITQWDLVCDKEYLKSVAEMFFLVGVAIGGVISGALSDKFGRRKMLFISAVLQSIFGRFTK